ncbi:MAG: PhnE/PtxC family ABC transporter permease [Panacagrimonas sp.]
MTALPPALRPSRRFRRHVGIALLIIGFLIGAFAYLKINPLLLITEFHYVWNLMGEMYPPNLELLWKNAELWRSIGETVAMAFLGTFFGGLLAFGLSFLAARNTAPNLIWRAVFRVFLALQRVAPDYAIMMVILIVVGFGPFAGTLALVIGSTGMFGKFFADAIENLEPEPTDGVRVLGGSRTQVFRYGIVPRVMPSFVANGFFLLEMNMAGAIALGAFGGGGLGFHLNIAYDTLNYRDMFAYVIFIVLLMMLIERGSDRWRKSIFVSGGTLK